LFPNELTAEKCRSAHVFRTPRGVGNTAPMAVNSTAGPRELPISDDALRGSAALPVRGPQAERTAGVSADHRPDDVARLRRPDDQVR
jgi:hypothetical protein